VGRNYRAAGGAHLARHAPRDALADRAQPGAERALLLHAFLLSG
jgi:hypothetical protein